MRLSVVALILFAAACATGSPRAKIADRFVDFGVSEERADCLASELDERLERDDLNDVADYIGGLNEATSAGEALDALLRIGNPRAAAAIARASLACALGHQN
jgi:hypothetical protein